MANKELHSVITIDNEDYSITANKVAQSLTIGEKSFDGSSAVEITATDLGAVQTTRKINTGDGLSGGGDLSADRTISVVIGEGIKIVSDAITAKAGNGITVDATGINHAKPTTVAANVTASGRKYITGVELDTYGHVTKLTTGTESVTDTNQKVKAGSVTFGANDEVNFVAGSNVTIIGSASDKTITISATGGGGGQTDLSGYATINYVDDAIADLEEVIPTHISQLTNDSEYLTSIPVTMDSGDTFTTITISKNEPSNGYIGDIWFKY